MRVIARMNGNTVPATLVLIIHGAPHRRMHVKMIQAYREEIRAACEASGINLPIDTSIHLKVHFIDPCSPDFDNLLVALYRAMDGSTLKPPGILTDDKLIRRIRDMSMSVT